MEQNRIEQNGYKIKFYNRDKIESNKYKMDIKYNSIEIEYNRIEQDRIQNRYNQNLCNFEIVTPTYILTLIRMIQRKKVLTFI